MFSFILNQALFSSSVPNSTSKRPEILAVASRW